MLIVLGYDLLIALWQGGEREDFAGSITIMSRWARLAGFEFFLHFQAGFHDKLQVAWRNGVGQC